MFNAISAAVSLQLGFAPLYTFALPNSTVSTEAQKVRALVKEVSVSVERSEALFGPKLNAISALRRLASECREINWDACGAIPIDDFAVYNAIAFIRALPDHAPLPDFAPEPDGSISMDWSKSRHILFSLSVGAGSRLAYAWLDGSDRGHGVAAFDRASVPPRVLEGILNVMQNDRLTTTN
jgi:hypothetical protein